MRRVFALVGLLAWSFASAAPGATGEPRGPSTAEERARALSLVDLIETRPTSPEAKEARSWLMLWLAAIPDMTISVCLDPLGDAADRKSLPADLAIHPVVAQAAFMIRHPEAKPKDTEVYVAGVLGALRTYEAMRAAGGVAELAAFEKLAKERAAGTLERGVEARSRRCK